LELLYAVAGITDAPIDIRDTPVEWPEQRA
jgi:hypothetical protein